MSEIPIVRVELIIPAPRVAVWDVLVDFARYPEWNPFTVGVHTTGRVGDPVLLDVKMRGQRLKMRERMRVRGLGAPRVLRLYRARIQAGFDANAHALLKRVTTLTALATQARTASVSAAEH